MAATMELQQQSASAYSPSDSLVEEDRSLQYESDDGGISDGNDDDTKSLSDSSSPTPSPSLLSQSDEQLKELNHSDVEQELSALSDSGVDDEFPEEEEIDVVDNGTQVDGEELPRNYSDVSSVPISNYVEEECREERTDTNNDEDHLVPDVDNNDSCDNGRGNEKSPEERRTESVDTSIPVVMNCDSDEGKENKKKTRKRKAVDFGELRRSARLKTRATNNCIS